MHRKGEYAKKAVFLGVKGYILKPLDEEELRTVLESAIRSLEQKRAGAQPALVYNEGNTTAERYLQRACAWMEEHCDEQITLRHVASELKISDSYLGKLFKSSGGPMFQEYLTLFRMKRAVRLLTEDPDIKIYEAAARCGYQDTKYFSTVFRRIVGVNPQDFKSGYRLSPGHILNTI